MTVYDDDSLPFFLHGLSSAIKKRLFSFRKLKSTAARAARRRASVAPSLERPASARRRSSVRVCNFVNTDVIGAYRACYSHTQRVYEME